MRQKHIIKVTVELRAVRLMVRFPCKLTFQLKTDRAQVSSANSYELSKGECTLNQILEAEAEVTFDGVSGEYEEANTRIILQMTSSNGVIPAGSVSFNPFHTSLTAQSLSLEKCPDRSAQITFCQSFQILRKNIIEEANQQQQGSVSKASRLLQKVTPTKQMSESKSGQGKYPRNGQGNSPNLPITLVNSRGASRNKVNPISSNFQRSSKQKNHLQHRDIDQPSYQLQTSHVVHKEMLSSRKYPEFHSSEKAQFLKEISSLKAELKGFQNEDRIDQLKTAKEENQHLESEVDKMREKVRIFERKQRQNNIQLKEARQESERQKSKYLQSETIRNESQAMLVEKERALKEMQAHVKRLQEQLQDLNAQLSNQQKRIEFKQNSYQEQFKKLSERYAHCEDERQKTTFDYNTLLAKLEQTEKRNQANGKDKDRSYTEEKSKLNKKIDQLSQNLNSLNELYKEKEGQLLQSHNQCKTLSKLQRERQQKLMAVSTDLELAKIMLSKQQQRAASMQKDISQYKIIEEERNTLKKRSGELNSQIAKLVDKIDRFSSDLSFSQAKVTQLENALADRTKQKDLINTKNNAAKKELDTLKREQERIMRETETLSVQHFNAGQKINELRTKLQAEKRDKEELKVYYEQQIAYLSKGKEYSERQIEEFKQSLENSKGQYEQATNRLRILNQEILQLNEEVLVNRQKVKRHQQNSQQLTKDVESLKTQIYEIQEREKQLNDQLKKKADIVYQLQKKHQSAENQLYMLRERLKQTESSFEERRFNQEKHLKDRERHLTAKESELTRLTMEVTDLKEVIQSISKQSGIKSNQIISLKDSLQTVRQNIINKEIKEQQVRDELQNTCQMFQTLKGNHDSVCKNLEEEKKTREKLKRDWEDYHRNTTSALEQLIQFIFKDEASPSQCLLTFPDSTLSGMQMEAIKRKKELFSHHRAIIQSLQQEKALLKAQITKQCQFVAQREEALQKIRQSQAKKYKQCISDLSSRQEQQEIKIEQMQEQMLNLTAEIQRCNLEIQKKQDLILQLQDQITITVDERQVIRTQLKTAQQNIIALKSNQIKWKASHQCQITDLNGHNQSAIQTYKNAINDLQLKISLQQKQKKQKDTTLKGMHAKINDLSFQKEKSEIYSLQLEQRCNDLTKQNKSLQNKIKSIQKQVKDGGNQLEESRRCAEHQKNKLNEVEAKLKETHANLLDAQIENQKIRAELAVCQDKMKNQQESFKEKADKLKTIGERSDKKIKELKEYIIKLNSTLELKDFQIAQSQRHASSLQENCNELKEQLVKKKAENVKLGDRLHESKNELLYNAQNIEILRAEKEFLSEENDRLKETANILEDEMKELQLGMDAFHQRQTESLKLKQQIEYLNSQFNFQRIQLQQQIQSLNLERESVRQKLKDKNHAEQKLIKGITNSDSPEQIQYYITNIKKILNYGLNENQIDDFPGYSKVHRDN